MRKNDVPYINVLRQYRQFMKYSQGDVASILGVSTVTISNWENGTAIPSAINMFKLSILYKVLPEVLYLELVKTLREDILIGIKKRDVEKTKSISKRINNKSIRYR